MREPLGEGALPVVGALSGRVSLAPLQGMRPGLAVNAVTATEDGTIIIGQIADSQVYVVTDPDLVNTMGLAQPNNADLVHRFFVDHLKARGVVVDATIHGFKDEPSLWAELFRFPLIILVLHLALLLALVVWAMMVRFGKPIAAAPRFPPGKQALVQNTAALLALGRHNDHTIGEYFRASLRAVATEAGLPNQAATHRTRMAQQQRVADMWGVDVDLEALDQRVRTLALGQDRAMLSLARDIHAYRYAMITHTHKRAATPARDT